MRRRSDWSDLPDEVREAIQRQTGEVTGSEPATTGEHSDITTAVTAPEGRLFLKGMRTTPETPDLWSLRREARINPYVHNLAPRLLLDVEAGGWRVLGFEHVEARHADYRPGSPDLATLAKVVTQLQEVDAPSLPCGSSDGGRT